MSRCKVAPSPLACSLTYKLNTQQKVNSNVNNKRRVLEVYHTNLNIF